MGREIQFYAQVSGKPFEWIESENDYSGVLLDYFCGSSILSQLIPRLDEPTKFEELQQDLAEALKLLKEEKEFERKSFENWSKTNAIDFQEYWENEKSFKNFFAELRKTEEFVSQLINFCGNCDVWVVDSF